MFGSRQGLHCQHQLGLGRIPVALPQQKRRLQLVGFETQEQLARLHRVSVADIHLYDLAGFTGADHHTGDGLKLAADAKPLHHRARADLRRFSRRQFERSACRAHRGSLDEPVHDAFDTLIRIDAAARRIESGDNENATCKRDPRLDGSLHPHAEILSIPVPPLRRLHCLS